MKARTTPRRKAETEPKEELRIDELARVAKTTIRNVRAYQDRGILPPPRREGRVAWYSSQHLARLRVVGTLLERGYSIANIAELIETWERGANLADLLGLEDALTKPFSAEPATTMTLGELAELAGTADPRHLSRAIEAGLVVPDGPTLRVPSPRLLRAGLELFKAGIPAEALFDEIARLRKDVDRIASRFVDLVLENVFDRFGDTAPPANEAKHLAELVHRARPLAEVVVAAELATALETHVQARIGNRMGKLLGSRAKKRA